MKLTKHILLFYFVWLSLTGYSQEVYSPKKAGVYFGLNSGTWFGTGNNKVLGNPPIFGLTLAVKSEISSLELNFDLIGFPKGKTTQDVFLNYNNTLLAFNEYNGAQMTLDYCHEIHQLKNTLFEFMTGIGYGGITYNKPESEISIEKNSFVFSPGISVRQLIGQSYFVQLKAQYCLANYHVKGNANTNLKGSYLITKLIIGVR